MKGLPNSGYRHGFILHDLTLEQTSCQQRINSNRVSDTIPKIRPVQKHRQHVGQRVFTQSGACILCQGLTKMRGNKQAG
jgi:hypothetical protein